MAETTLQPQSPPERQSSGRLVSPVAIIIILVLLGLIIAQILIGTGITDKKTGNLRVTIANYAIEDRNVAIYIDREHSTDKTVLACSEWTSLIELTWTGAHSIKEVSLVCGDRTLTKQVQMIEGSIVSVSFELY